MRSPATPDAPDIELPEAEETGPVRQCAVTRARKPKEQLIRFVVSPDRLVVPDLAARLPGRGIWLSAERDVIESAAKRGVFARAACGPVTLPPDLPALLKDALTRRIVDALGLTRRAGQAVSGFAKAREWIASGRAALVVEAADGSADERSRLLSGARHLPVVAVLDAAALGTVFGRDHVVHVAIAPGRLAERLIVDGERWMGLSGQRQPAPTGRSGGDGEQAGL